MLPKNDPEIKYLQEKVARRDERIEIQAAEIKRLKRQLEEKELALRNPPRRNNSFFRECYHILGLDYDPNCRTMEDDICGYIRDLFDGAIFWEDKAKEYREVNSDLESRLKKRMEAYKNARHDYDNIKKDYEALTEKFEEAQQLAKEKIERVEENCRQEVLQERKRRIEEVSELKSVHFRAVREIDGGVKPINDDYVASRFTTLRDDVSDWTRLSIKQLTGKWTPDVKDCLEDMCEIRYLRGGQLSHMEIVQALIWKILEENMFGGWLFGIGKSRDIERIEQCLQDLGPAKVQEWRVFTISRLRDSPRLTAIKESFVNRLLQETESILSIMTEAREGRVSHKASSQKLRSIFSYAADLAAELKTQKSVFVIDDNVKPNMPYDPETMKEVMFTEEPEELRARGAKVSCVISNGWIKRSGDEDSNDSCRICKAMVRVI